MATQQTQNDVPLPLAAFALLAVACGYLYLNYFRFEPLKMELLRTLAEQHSDFWWTSLVGLAVNLVFVGIFLKRTVGLERQGSKLEILQGKAKSWKFGKAEVVAGLLSIGAFSTVRRTVVAGIAPTMVRIMAAQTASSVILCLAGNLAIFVYFVSRLSLRLFGGLSFSSGDNGRLHKPLVESGELVLGTTPGELSVMVDSSHSS